MMSSRERATHRRADTRSTASCDHSPGFALAHAVRPTVSESHLSPVHRVSGSLWVVVRVSGPVLLLLALLVVCLSPRPGPIILRHNLEDLGRRRRILARLTVEGQGGEKDRVQSARA